MVKLSNWSFTPRQPRSAGPPSCVFGLLLTVNGPPPCVFGLSLTVNGPPVCFFGLSLTAKAEPPLGGMNIKFRQKKFSLRFRKKKKNLIDKKSIVATGHSIPEERFCVKGQQKVQES